MSRTATGQITHSEKGLLTLTLMGCEPTGGWVLPEIEWVTVRRLVPTRVGRGRTVLVERDVQEGRVVWPEGTTFPSRFDVGQRCGLCGKRVRHLVPVAGHTTAGAPVGMWLGEDCARTTFRVETRGLTLADATREAADAADVTAARAAVRLVREVPVAKPAPKPKGPALEHPDDKATLDALVVATFGAHVLDTTYSTTRSQLTYYVLVEETPNGERHSFEVILSARFGTHVRLVYGPGAHDYHRTIAKHRDRFDVAAVLAAALPAVRAALLRPPP